MVASPRAVLTTSADEVFLLVARGDSVGEKEVVQSSRRLEQDEGKIELQDGNLFIVHLIALFKKRASNFRRDKKAWMCTTLLPSLFVMIGFLVYRNAGRARSLPTLSLDLSSLNAGVSGDFINPIHYNIGEYSCLPGSCVHNPIVSIVQTSENYTYCGGITSVDDAVCSIFESSLIVDRLNGFKGADFVESESTLLREVRSWTEVVV